MTVAQLFALLDSFAPKAAAPSEPAGDLPTLMAMSRMPLAG